MIYFNIPGIVDHFDLNTFFLRLEKEHPEFFLPNRKIGSIYGNFHYCIWDGGRNFVYYKQSTKEEMQQVIFTYNQIYNIPIRYIFTNPILEEKHLFDRFGNLMLKLGNNFNNEVVVNSSLMENYIKENYPNYKIISSTTKRITNQEKAFSELNKDYYQVCLDYDLNKDEEFLSKISKENIDKVEFLCNAICPSKCPYRKQHYLLNGKTQLSFLQEFYDIPKCGITNNITHPSILGKGNNLSNEDIDRYAEKYKFAHFKLEGRTLRSVDVLTNYLYYLIKPEYYFEIMSMSLDVPNILFNDPNSPIICNINEKPMIQVHPTGPLV